jgi:hypothetical protein
MSTDFDPELEKVSPSAPVLQGGIALAAVLPFPPEGWTTDHTIHFTGEGAELHDARCFIPFVSRFMKRGDHVDFRIECAGVWGERFCGGGRIVQSAAEDDRPGTTPGIWLDIVYLDLKCRDALLAASVSHLSFPRA